MVFRVDSLVVTHVLLSVMLTPGETESGVCVNMLCDLCIFSVSLNYSKANLLKRRRNTTPKNGDL